MKSGFVSLLGRPNAGKSTLLNRIVGQKLAIVSDKPQTTRTRVVGVKNYPDGTDRVRRHSRRSQADAPAQRAHGGHRAGVDAEVDVLALVVDASVKPGKGDRYMLDLLKERRQPAILVLNKVDLVAKHKLLPLIDHYRQEHPFVEIVPRRRRTGRTSTSSRQLFLSTCRKASRCIRRIT